MTSYRGLDLFSRALLARGVVLALAGAVALRWPDDALSVAMAVAGGAVLAAGAGDLAVARAAGRAFRGWPVIAAHGAASVAFGALTLAARRAHQLAPWPLVAGWMACYGLLLATLALALWPWRRPRWALLGATAVVAAAAAVTTLTPELPPFASLYLGAAFAVLLGVVHAVAGLWLRRAAMPAVAPTLQSSWAPPVMPPGARPAARR